MSFWVLLQVTTWRLMVRSAWGTILSNLSKKFIAIAPHRLNMYGVELQLNRSCMCCVVVCVLKLQRRAVMQLLWFLSFSHWICRVGLCRIYFSCKHFHSGTITWDIWFGIMLCDGKFRIGWMRLSLMLIGYLLLVSCYAFKGWLLRWRPSQVKRPNPIQKYLIDGGPNRLLFLFRGPIENPVIVGQINMLLFHRIKKKFILFSS